MGGYGMKRENEIIAEADCSYEGNYKSLQKLCFIDGAKWADKSMMERVLTFFNTHFYDHPHVHAHICTDSFESLEQMEAELIKAMEE